MTLRAFLKKQGGTYTFYGITDKQELCSPGYQLRDVNNKSALVREIRNAVFKRAPKGVFVFVSDKAWYVGHIELKKASIVTLSLNKARGKKEFEHELRASKRWRARNLRYVKNMLVPFLKKTFGKSKLVLGAVLRGDIVDTSRYPGPYSDINIILLTGFESNNKSSKNALLKLLKGSPGQTSYDYYNFKPNIYSDEGEKNLNSRGEEFGVEYSIISLPDARMLASHWKKSGITICRYEQINIPKAEVLLNKGGAAKEFLNIIKSFSSRH